MKKKIINNPVVIIANGEFPRHHIPLEILDHAKTIICCDGSINSLIRLQKEPDYIIGDMDSIDDKLKIQFEDKLIIINHQNTNDLYKTLSWCVENNIEKTYILGATGKREDHTLNNILQLLDFANQLIVKVITDTGVFTFNNKSKIYSSFKGQQISIFYNDLSIRLKSKNLKFPLDNIKLSNYSQMTLNESKSNEFIINISHGSILVFQCHENIV